MQWHVFSRIALFPWVVLLIWSISLKCKCLIMISDEKHVSSQLKTLWCFIWCFMRYTLGQRIITARVAFTSLYKSQLDTGCTWMKSRKLDFRPRDYLRVPKLQLPSCVIATRDSMFCKMFSPLFCFEQETTLKNFSKKLYTSKIKKRGRRDEK